MIHYPSSSSSSLSSRLAINAPDFSSRLWSKSASPCRPRVCRWDIGIGGQGDLSLWTEDMYEKLCIRSKASAVGEKFDIVERSSDVKTVPLSQHFSVVMKFGGSSVASAARMREVADLVLSFPEESPIIVLFAMDKTTNNLLQAGENAVNCGVAKSFTIKELNIVKELHLSTAKELKVDSGVIAELLEELSQLITGIALMKELTICTKDYLVSFGECLSTRIFAAYLQQCGVKARQYDVFDLGFITTDESTNAEILEATDWSMDPRVISIIREEEEDELKRVKKVECIFSCTSRIVTGINIVPKVISK